jgi:hypothetical protein
MSQSVANSIRRLYDASLTKTKALPAAAAANYTDSVDLGNTILGPTADDVELLVSIEATPSLADTKSITLTIKDSADDSTFTALASAATLVVTGASSAGAAAAERRYKLPPGTRRYLRVDAAVESSGGSNIAKSYSFKILANP